MTSSFRYSINIHHSNISAAQADGVNIYNSYAILGFCSQLEVNEQVDHYEIFISKMAVDRFLFMQIFYFLCHRTWLYEHLQQVSYKKKHELLTLHDQLGSPLIFGGIRVAHLFNLQCCVFSLMFIYHVCEVIIKKKEKNNRKFEQSVISF